MVSPAARRMLSEPVVLAVILVAARLLFLVDGADGPFFADLVMDERVHWDWAGQILDHGTLGEAFFRAPLYYYLLALLRLATSDSVLLCRLLGSLAGVAAALLVFRITRRLTDGRGWAWAAALGYGLAPEILFFDTRLLSDPLAALLALAALELMLTERSPPLVGVAIGLAALTRPTAMILVPLYVGWLALARPSLRQLARRSVLAIGAVLLTVSPATVINAVTSRDFVLIAWNGGVNFFIGNNPRSDGMTAVHPDFRADWWGSYHDFVYHAERDLGRELGPSEISGYWFGEGVEFLLEEPAAALRLQLEKARLYFSGVEISNNIAITPYLEEATPWFGRLPNWSRLLLVFYASCAAVLVTRSWRTAPVLLSVYALAHAAATIAFFVTSRYRLPALPVLAIVGAHALWQISGDLRRRWPHLLALAAYTPLVLSTSLPASFPAYHVAVANTELQRGELDAAERSFRRAADYADPYPQVAEGLAMVAEARGDPERAIPLYERELEVYGSVFAAFRLAAIHYDAGRPEQAYPYSSRIRARYADAALLHAKVCLALERFDEAEEALLDNLAQGFDVEDSEYLLATVYLVQGRPEADAIMEKYRDHPKFDRLRQLQEMLRRRRSGN
jgi:4-amino-4-deoxy-L-arabinose transferase-like glycosyltransferase